MADITRALVNVSGAEESQVSVGLKTTTSMSLTFGGSLDQSAAINESAVCVMVSALYPSPPYVVTCPAAGGGRRRSRALQTGSSDSIQFVVECPSIANCTSLLPNASHVGMQAAASLGVELPATSQSTVVKVTAEIVQQVECPSGVCMRMYP